MLTFRLTGRQEPNYHPIVLFDPELRQLARHSIRKGVWITVFGRLFYDYFADNPHRNQYSVNVRAVNLIVHYRSDSYPRHPANEPHAAFDGPNNLPHGSNEGAYALPPAVIEGAPYLPYGTVQGAQYLTYGTIQGAHYPPPGALEGAHYLPPGAFEGAHYLPPGTFEGAHYLPHEAIENPYYVPISVPEEASGSHPANHEQLEALQEVSEPLDDTSDFETATIGDLLEDEYEPVTAVNESVASYLSSEGNVAYGLHDVSCVTVETNVESEDENSAKEGTSTRRK